LNAGSREPSLASEVEPALNGLLLQQLVMHRDFSFKQKLDLAVEATLQNKKISYLNQLNTTSILLNNVQVRKSFGTTGLNC